MNIPYRKIYSKNRHVGVRLTKDEKHELVNFCHQSKMTISDILRSAIDTLMDKD